MPPHVAARNAASDGKTRKKHKHKGTAAARDAASDCGEGSAVGDAVKPGSGGGDETDTAQEAIAIAWAASFADDRAQKVQKKKRQEKKKRHRRHSRVPSPTLIPSPRRSRSPSRPSLRSRTPCACLLAAPTSPDNGSAVGDGDGSAVGDDDESADGDSAHRTGP